MIGALGVVTYLLVTYLTFYCFKLFTRANNAEYKGSGTGVDRKLIHEK